MLGPHIQVRGQIWLSEKETPEMAKERSPSHHFQERSSESRGHQGIDRGDLQSAAGWRDIPPRHGKIYLSLYCSWILTFIRNFMPLGIV